MEMWTINLSVDFALPEISGKPIGRPTPYGSDTAVENYDLTIVE